MKAKPVFLESNSKINQSDFFAPIVTNLSVLERANAVQKQAASVGFDWDNWHPILAKISEEALEVEEAVQQKESQQRIAEEMGDLLFAVSNLARHLQVDSEIALLKANAKFERRFNQLLDEMKQSDQSVQDASLEEMECFWRQVKEKEHKFSP